MQGVGRYHVSLSPFTSEWATEFEAVRAELAALLGINAACIHHIGSTAIQGLVAKPVLDIAIELTGPPAPAIAALQRAGYEYRETAGVANREFFVLRSPEGLSLRHISCFAAGNPALRNHLLFRDYLNTHAEYAARYAQLKQQLAEKYPTNRMAYTEGKADFIRHVLTLAGGTLL